MLLSDVHSQPLIALGRSGLLGRDRGREPVRRRGRGAGGGTPTFAVRTGLTVRLASTSGSGDFSAMDPDLLLAELWPARRPRWRGRFRWSRTAGPASSSCSPGCTARLGRARRIGITGPPGRRQVHAGRAPGRRLPRRRSPGRRRRGRSHQPLHRRRPARRPHPHGIRRPRQGVYIRSMASRGSLGGLATTTREVCDLLDAAGFDRILVETVGVGQSELDVARMADTTVLVLVPESGDGIQTLKSGVMEVGGHVRREQGRPPGRRQAAPGDRGDAGHPARATRSGTCRRITGGARRSARRATAGRAGRRPTPGSIRSCSTVAAKGEGIDELIAALDRHHDWLDAQRRARRAPASAAAGPDPRGGGSRHAPLALARRRRPSS